MVNEIPGQAGDGVSRPLVPNKLFFRIGEVSQLLGVEAYVLRYWESEFPALNPKKSPTGQRMFRRKDVELLFEIKHLLYERKFTLEGARKSLLEKNKTDVVRKITAPQLETQLNPLLQIREELTAILELLR